MGEACCVHGPEGPPGRPRAAPLEEPGGPAGARGARGAAAAAAGGGARGPLGLRCEGNLGGPGEAGRCPGGGELQLAWGSGGIQGAAAPFKIAWQPAPAGPGASAGARGPGGEGGGEGGGGGGGVAGERGGAGQEGPEWEAERPGTPLLAVVDEEGFCSLVDPGKLPAPWEGGAGRARGADGNRGLGAVRQQWLAHNNAIFDVCWLGRGRLATAAGDHTVAVWDVERGGREPRCSASLRGHTLTVKSLAVPQPAASSGNGCHGEGFILASGARDGTVRLWDLRAPGSVSVDNRVPGRRLHGGTQRVFEDEADQAPLPDGGEVLSPVSVMQSGKWGRNWWRGRHRGPMQFSITSVAFAGKNLLAAAMDRTGGIRLWDLRSSRILGDLPQTPAPGQATSHESSGVTSIAADPSGSGLLLSSVFNGPVLLYDPALSLSGPVRHFEGPCINSFFIRAGFSPDGSHVVCGDGGPKEARNGRQNYFAYVWETNGGPEAVTKLVGHTKEVSDVAWTRDAAGRDLLATCSDDSTLRVHVSPPPGPRDWRAECQGTPFAAAAARRRRGWFPNPSPSLGPSDVQRGDPSPPGDAQRQPPASRVGQERCPAASGLPPLRLLQGDQGAGREPRATLDQWLGQRSA